MSHLHRIPEVSQPDVINFPTCTTDQDMGHLQVSARTQCLDYKYEPLKRPTEIRLMKFDVPADGYQDISDETSIFCDIVHVNLESAPQYKAISYVWGDMTDTKLVTLTGGCHLFIGNSLYSALNALRSQPEMPEKPLYVWADQICINQSDDEERGKQVELMGSIYSQACYTMVWLEGHTEKFAGRSHYFIWLLAHSSISLPWAHDMFYKRNSEAVLRHLVPRVMSLEDLMAGAASVEELSQNAWFTRLWTFQEFVVSPRADFFWASRRCSRHDLLQAFYLTRLLLDRSTTGSYHSGALWKYHQLHKNNKKPDLLQLLGDISDSAYQCKLPHDRIYALLGLQSSPLPIPVDYSLPIAELLVRTAVEILRSTRSLRLLHRRISDNPLTSPHPTLLPSWVPDWTKTTFQFSLNDRRVAFTSGGKARPYVFRSPEAGVISARGKTVAKIEEIFPHEFREGLLGDKLYAEFLGAGTLIPTALGRLLAKGKVVARHHHEAKAKANWLLAMTFTGGRYAKVCPSEFDPKKGSLPELIAKGKVSDLRSLGKCKGRRLAMLASERTPIGLIPDCAGVGDEVCVLEGSDTPLVLRRNGGRWVNRGEGYVHGIMNGEEVDWEEGGGREFWIE